MLFKKLFKSEEKAPKHRNPGAALLRLTKVSVQNATASIVKKSM